MSKIDSNRADLTVEVEELERTSFGFGARYDSERKASAFITGKYRNLLVPTGQSGQPHPERSSIAD
jgi:outer membrane protein assembly factor BamA